MRGKGHTKHPPEFGAPREPITTRANPTKITAIATGKRRLILNAVISAASGPC
jgi:hypothetical protein